MNYELVRIIEPTSFIWKKQKKRIQARQGKVITIAPCPTFNQIVEREKVSGLNLIDVVTQRQYNSEGFLFFNQVPTVSTAEIFMNENGTLSIIHDGTEIGVVKLYPNTRRLVQSVEYLNQDSTVDFIEEYATDGSLFSTIFFHEKKAERIDFVNSNQRPILSYFFYQGQSNFVTIRDEKTFQVVEKYKNINDFIAQQLASILTEKDTVAICYMGMEMYALEKTCSYNILYLEESPIDEHRQIKANLKAILENQITYIQEVKMTRTQYDLLRNYNVSLKKITVLD